jgi:hypothetical protein
MVRLPRPRFTVRRLMALVAIAALGAGAVATARRVVVRREWAAYHATRLEEAARWEADWRERGDRVVLHNLSREGAEAVAARLRRAIPFHQAMRRKWEDSSVRPWLPVEHDPPESKMMAAVAVLGGLLALAVTFQHEWRSDLHHLRLGRQVVVSAPEVLDRSATAVRAGTRAVVVTDQRERTGSNSGDREVVVTNSEGRVVKVRRDALRSISEDPGAVE